MLNIPVTMMKLKGNVYSATIEKEYRNLLKNQYLRPNEIAKIKLEKFKILLKHAYKSTSFYRRKMDEIGLVPDDVQSYEDIKSLPTVSREDLNNHLDEMISNDIDQKMIHKSATGGSTGLRTVFARDNKCLEIKKASEFRFNNFTGWIPGERILYYWPALMDYSSGNSINQWSKIKSVINQHIAERQLMLYAGALDEEILSEHIKRFSSFKPALVRAFPNSLQVFAEYVKMKNISFYVKRGIICVGEPVNDYQRQLFREVFNCDIFNCYVSRETGNIACECHEHNGLHICDDMLHFEIDSENPTEYGEVVLTDLENFGMPLIRYRIQDASIFSSTTCKCGRGLKLIDFSTARLNDFLISPIDGSFISGSTIVHYLLAEGHNLDRFQIIQVAPEKIKLKISASVIEKNEAIQHIKKVVQKLFKYPVNIEIETADSIPFLKSGKFQFVKREF